MTQLMTTLESTRILRRRFSRSTGASHICCCRFGRLQVQHHVPNSFQLLCQGAPLGPSLTSLDLRQPCIPEQSCKWSFPTRRASRQRTLPFRAVSWIFLRQFDVCLPPLIVAAPCYSFFPVPALPSVIRRMRHLAGSLLYTAHRKDLNTRLALLLQLPRHHWSCPLDALHPGLVCPSVEV